MTQYRLIKCEAFILTFIVHIPVVVLAQDATRDHDTDKSGRHISLRSAYLALPVEGFHQVTLIGDIKNEEGKGHLELNPNSCSLNEFGDPEICTEIALTDRTIRLYRTRFPDPLNLNRQLWVIAHAGLPGALFLVVPDTEGGIYRLVYESRNGSRRVIAMEPLVYGGERVETMSHREDKEEHCRDLAITVDDVTAQAELRAGFVTNTYFLTLRGKKPNLNSWVELSPVRYPKQPTYWRIDVKECHPGVVLPAIGAYDFTAEVTQTMGTKGIELHWADGEVERIERP